MMISATKWSSSVNCSHFQAVFKLQRFELIILSAIIIVCLNTPFSQTHGDPLPLEKLAKISSLVENYTPNFAPAEKDEINNSSLQKSVLFFPPPLNFLTFEFKPPAKKVVMMSIPI